MRCRSEEEEKIVSLVFLCSEAVQTLQCHFITEFVLLHCLHHVGFVVSQRLDCVKNVHDVLLLDHLTDATDGTKRPAASSARQAVDDCTSISSVILLLPFGQSSDQLQDGAFGQRRVSVRRPTDELEMLDQPVAVLRPSHVADPKNAIDNVLVNVSGDELDLYGPITAGAFLWPILHAELCSVHFIQHDDGGAVVIKHEPPEVGHGVGQRVLRHDEGRWLFVAVHQRCIDVIAGLAINRNEERQASVHCEDVHAAVFIMVTWEKANAAVLWTNTRRHYIQSLKLIFDLAGVGLRVQSADVVVNGSEFTHWDCCVST